MSRNQQDGSEGFRHILRPTWWLPSRFDLRRGLVASLGLHLVSLVAYSVLAQPRFEPPERLNVIPVQLVPMPAPVIPKIDPVPERPKIKEVVPDPLQKSPPPKKEPPKKPPEPKIEKKKEEPPPKPPEETKLGKLEPEDPPPEVKVERPAIGEEPASLEVVLEGPEFEFSGYIRRMRLIISSHWKPPVGAIQSERDVSAVVHFRIERDGRIATIYVDEPSGSGLFDQAALRALQLTDRLPPLPPAYPQDWLGVKLRFVYRE